LRAASARLAEPWPIATEALLAAPARLAPYAFGDEALGTVAATAALGAGGEHALASSSAVPQGSPAVWVRNGLGRTVRASVERRFEVAGIEFAVLALESPLPAPAEQTTAARAPFAGSVGYAVEYAAQASGEAAWPRLELGFFGRSVGADGLPALGIGVPPGPRGGPVLDDAGRVVGVAARAADGSDRLVPVAALPEDVRPLLGPAMLGGPTPRSSPDVIYERALRSTLQLIVAPATRD
jgi:hypothetical protein